MTLYEQCSNETKIILRRSFLSLARYKLETGRWSDATALAYLNDHISLQSSHEATQARLRYLRSFKPVAEGGMVEIHDRVEWDDQTETYVRASRPYICVVWSGRDCDGVQYSGEVHWIDCSEGGKQAVEAHVQATLDWADGPCHYFLMRPSEAQMIHYRSRDLAMEAFEDGHAHVLSEARFDEEGDYQ